MSLRNEQCNKVCRILDDVLANRPTERDSLITAVRKAFGALETEPQWIPCSERLPDSKGYVLVTDYGETDMGRRFCGKWWLNCCGDKMKDVTAWMPLPEPYVERRTDG